MNRQQSVLTRHVLIVTAVLCLVAAILGLRLGAEKAAITESDLIDAAVARWMSETGERDVSSCIGRAPDDSDVWLEVRCGMGQSKRIYRFDGKGNLLTEAEPST